MPAHPGGSGDAQMVAWQAQRHAQRGLGLEERIRQNDALAGLWATSAGRGGDRSAGGRWVGGPSS